MKKLWNSFKIAFAMYSKIPMPQSEWTEENMSYAMCFFPWVGAVTGGISYLVVLFADLLKEREISFGSLFFPAVLTVLPVLISGGIHMDGFLDTQDALSSWQSEEKRLEILKDPHAGAFAILFHLESWHIFRRDRGEHAADRDGIHTIPDTKWHIRTSVSSGKEKRSGCSICRACR